MNLSWNVPAAAEVKICILGNGYVGTATACALLRASRPLAVTMTHRGSGLKEEFQSKIAELHHAAAVRNSLTLKIFELCEIASPLNESLATQASLEALGDFDAVLLTFPCEFLTLQSRLAIETRLAAGKPFFMLSSSACYLEKIGTLNESSPRLLTHNRFGREESFRLQGATLLPLTGLYGGARQPLHWIERGLVKDLSGSVSLIHHDDAALCISELVQAAVAQTFPYSGNIINVCSGATSTWVDIAKASLREDLVAGVVPRPPIRKISNEKLLNLIPGLRNHAFQGFGEAFAQS